MIIITRGYPASGKTTWAKEWVQEAPMRARVSRDDFRAMVFAVAGVLPYEREQLVTKLQREAVVRLVKGGHDVVVDDTNLRAKFARAWADLAVELGVEFHIANFDTPADACVAYDATRIGRQVGEDVIRSMAAKFPIGRWPEIIPSIIAPQRSWPVYTPKPGFPPTWIVDIDGTIAAKRMGEGERGWHEYARVNEDNPKPVIIRLVNNLCVANNIIFVSGRKSSCRGATRAWLSRHVGPWAFDAPLYMRDTDDNRADDIVKNELFETKIAPMPLNIQGAIDDRQRVVDMWRAKGLTCLQVDAWEEAGS